MRLEQARLKNQPDTFLIKDLRLAASKLNHETYLRYKARQARSHLYLVNKVIDATTNEALIFCNQVNTQMHHLENSQWMYAQGVTAKTGLLNKICVFMKWL